MNNIIIGTAGHVDHGKTVLVKALTGVDTDKLEEEKKRGITIELGFTNLPNKENLDIGIIDVPGHEKFIKNMLAGIGGIDIVLLVIAADESIMPQTIEHFNIVKNLGIKKGIIVITKIDKVTSDYLDLVEMEIKELVEDSFLESSEIIKVSAKTGENIETLKKALIAISKEIKEKNNSSELFRMPIDRVFVKEGFGTVVTGTTIEGSVSVGDKVEIFTRNEEVKVRNIQVYGESVDRAYAGQRTAINFAKTKKNDIARGDVLAKPKRLENSMMLDTLISIFSNSKYKLKDGSRVHLYIGSKETIAKVVLLETESNNDIKAGDSGYVQLRLVEDIAVKRGDKFIIRFFSPVETIGGGLILNANPKKHKKNRQNVIESLKILNSGSLKEIMYEIVADSCNRFLSKEILVVKSGIGTEESIDILNKLVLEKRIVSTLGGRFSTTEYMLLIEGKLKEALEKFYKNSPLEKGLKIEEARNKLGDILHIEDTKIVADIFDYIVENSNVLVNNKYLMLQDKKTEISEYDQRIVNEILKIYNEKGHSIVLLDSILEEMNINVKNEKLKDLLMFLVDKGDLVKLADKYYTTSKLLLEAMDTIVLILKKEGVTLGNFRDNFHTSRKSALLILDYLEAKNKIYSVDNVRYIK